MASRALPQDAPLAVLLAAIPSLPRPLLARLTARLIDRLDQMDGDENLEENGDLEGIDEREETFEDLEREQMGDDVPCPFVYAAEPDPETGQRKCLGRWGIDTMPHFIGRDTSA